MARLDSWLSADVMHALGWALIHSLWQCLGLAALAAILMAFSRRPTIRYLVATAALVAMLAAPMALTQLGQIVMMTIDLALIGRLGDEAIALLRWHGAIIVGRTLQEALMRAILAEEHAQQLLTALSHGRPLAPVPATVDRGELYAKVLSARTHDMHFGYAATFVEITPGAKGG